MFSSLFVTVWNSGGGEEGNGPVKVCVMGGFGWLRVNGR